MNNKTALLIIGILLLFGLILFLLHSNAQVDEQLILAEAEVEQAREALEGASLVTAEKEEQLQAAKAEYQEVLHSSSEAISRLKQEASLAEDRYSELSAGHQELKDQIDQLVGGQVTPDPQPVAVVLREGISLYPEQDFSGAEIVMNDAGRDLFQLMVAEITSGRELRLQSEQLNAECNDQVARLQAVIREHERMEFAMGRAYKAQEDANTALRDENLKLKGWGRSLEDQVELYKKRHSPGWLDKVEKALALYGIFKIGEGILEW